MPKRLQASLIHLSASLLIAATIATLTLIVWYPSPLARAAGVAHIFLVLLSVDMCLGPLMTLIVYNPNKKSLKLDLSIIVVVQLIALAYGVHTVFIARPAYVVFNVDRFDLVQANEIDRASASKASEATYRAPSWLGPRWVGADLPKDVAARNAILMRAVAGGADLPQLPEYYAPLAVVNDQIRSRLRPLEELKKFNAQRDAETRALVDAVQADASTLGYLPLRARNEDMTVLVKRTDGTIVRVIPVSPWAG